MPTQEIHCRDKSCKMKFGSELGEIRHWGKVHGPNASWRNRKGLNCTFEGCHMGGFTSQEQMRRHIRSVHDQKTPEVPSVEEFRKPRKNQTPVLSIETPEKVRVEPFVHSTEGLEENEYMRAISIFTKACSSQALSNLNAYNAGAKMVLDIFQRELAEWSKQK